MPIKLPHKYSKKRNDLILNDSPSFALSPALDPDVKLSTGQPSDDFIRYSFLHREYHHCRCEDRRVEFRNDIVYDCVDGAEFPGNPVALICKFDGTSTSGGSQQPKEGGLSFMEYLQGQYFDKTSLYTNHHLTVLTELTEDARRMMNEITEDLQKSTMVCDVGEDIEAEYWPSAQNQSARLNRLKDLLADEDMHFYICYPGKSDFILTVPSDERGSAQLTVTRFREAGFMPTSLAYAAMEFCAGSLGIDEEDLQSILLQDRSLEP
ncbi:hypothetical protein V8F33_006928 [Rhypophila sp. PSN 637]